jgi:preprotein translocase subunit YajC
MDFFISPAMAQAADAPSGSSQAFSSLIIFGGMALIFYFMIFRPQSKRAKEHKALTEGIQKGDEIMTTGGVLGKVKKISGDYIVLQIADNVDLKLQKSSVAASLPKDTIKGIDKATD